MDSTTVSLVNQLSLAAAAIIACGVLWRAYKGAHDEHIKDLREAISNGLGDIRSRVAVIEDRDGIIRPERHQFIPPANAKERDVLGNLDALPERKYSDKLSERDKFPKP
jgi:hypothetical protein